MTKSIDFLRSLVLGLFLTPPPLPPCTRYDVIVQLMLLHAFKQPPPPWMCVYLLVTRGWLKKLVNPCLPLKVKRGLRKMPKEAPPTTGWLATSLVMDISLSSVCLEVKGCCYCTQTQLMLLEGLLRYGDGGGGCSHSITHRPLVSANNLSIQYVFIWYETDSWGRGFIVQSLREGRYPRASHKYF